MAITQYYDLDLVPNGAPVVVNCSQYDDKSRIFRFTMYEDGQLANIPSGASITIRGFKPDKTAFSYSATRVTANVITATIQTQMSIVAGNVPCELRITNGHELIGTANFILYVEPSPYGDDVAISETTMSEFEEAIEAGRKADEAIAAANDAEDKANEAIAKADAVSPENDGEVGWVLQKTATGAKWFPAAGGGSVNTVNDIGPDASGNVELNANHVPYRNTSSGLTSTNVQDVIDELESHIQGEANGLSDKNIDNWYTDKYFGTWYMQMSNSMYTGTKPDTTQQGLLFVKKQTSEYVRQIYFANDGAQYVRYYRISTDTWTAWSQDSTSKTVSDLGLATTAKDGLLRKLSGDTTQFMRGDGTWNVPPTFTGATASAAGKVGYVKAPTAGQQDLFLKGNGNWATPPTFTGATDDADGVAGYVLKPTAGNQRKFLRADRTWSAPFMTALGSQAIGTVSGTKLITVTGGKPGAPNTILACIPIGISTVTANAGKLFVHGSGVIASNRLGQITVGGPDSSTVASGANLVVIWLYY